MKYVLLTLVLCGCIQRLPERPDAGPYSFQGKIDAGARPDGSRDDRELWEDEMSVIGRISPDSERADWWREAYGSLEVPLESATLEIAEGPFGPDLFYKVDIERLTKEQIGNAIVFIHKRFGVPIDEVREGVLNQEGIPVLASDVTVHEL